MRMASVSAWLAIAIMAVMGRSAVAAAEPHVSKGDQVLMTDLDGRTFIGVVTTAGAASLVISDPQGRSIERPWEDVRDVTRFVVPPATRREQVARRESGVLGRMPLLWVDAGAGGASAEGLWQLGLSGQWKRAPVIRVRYVHLWEDSHAYLVDRVPYEDTDETAVLAQWRGSRRYGSVAAGLGFSWVQGIQRGDYSHSTYLFSPYGDHELARHYTSRRFDTVGVAAELDATWTPSRFWGLGMTVLGDANPERPFWGVSFGLQVGHVTRRH